MKESSHKKAIGVALGFVVCLLLMSFRHSVKEVHSVDSVQFQIDRLTRLRDEMVALVEREHNEKVEMVKRESEESNYVWESVKRKSDDSDDDDNDDSSKTSDTADSEESSSSSTSTNWLNKAWIRFLMVLGGIIVINMLAICIQHIYTRITTSTKSYRTIEHTLSPF